MAGHETTAAKAIQQFCAAVEEVIDYLPAINAASPEGSMTRALVEFEETLAAAAERLVGRAHLLQVHPAWSTSSETGYPNG